MMGKDKNLKIELLLIMLKVLEVQKGRKRIVKIKNKYVNRWITKINTN